MPCAGFVIRRSWSVVLKSVIRILVVLVLSGKPRIQVLSGRYPKSKIARFALRASYNKVAARGVVLSGDRYLYILERLWVCKSRRANTHDEDTTQPKEDDREGQGYALRQVRLPCLRGEDWNLGGLRSMWEDRGHLGGLLMVRVFCSECDRLQPVRHRQTTEPREIVGGGSAPTATSSPIAPPATTPTPLTP